MEAALVLVVALWQLGPSMAAGSGPRLAMDMLAGNSVTCDQGELVGIVEDVELLSIGHSKNVYRGVLKRRDSTVALPVVLKEYRITRRRTEAEVEAPSTGDTARAVDARATLECSVPRPYCTLRIFAANGGRRGLFAS